MSRMPGALWKPLAANWAAQPRMRAHNIICIHTMVGGLDGTDSLFRANNGPGYDGTESHYGTGGDGTKVQWQDTQFQADANYLGNPDVISLENADHGPEFPKWTGSDVPPLTPAQVEANAQIVAWESSPAAHADCPPSWICHREGIPLEVIPDSKPGRRGIAPHRLGVPGYMVAGAVQWSTANRKACPGDRRIAQIPQIIARAKQIRGGAAASPTPLQEDIVRIAVDPGNTCYILRELSVVGTGDIGEVNALCKLYGVPIVSATRADIQKAIDSAARAAAALYAGLAKAMPGPDLDEEKFAAAVIAKLEGTPVNPLTEDDIQRLLDDSEIDTVNLLAARLSSSAA